MPSLIKLAALADQQGALDTLEQRIVVQQAALDDAIDDLQAARARLGAPAETPRLSGLPDGGSSLSADQVHATAEFILRADRRRRGEEPIPAPVIARAIPQAPSTPQGTAAVAAFILAADRKRRGIED